MYFIHKQTRLLVANVNQYIVSFNVYVSFPNVIIYLLSFLYFDIIIQYYHRHNFRNTMNISSKPMYLRNNFNRNGSQLNKKTVIRAPVQIVYEFLITKNFSCVSNIIKNQSTICTGAVPSFIVCY